jgi:MFS family permease
MVNGFIVGGFGFAAVFYAPLVAWLLRSIEATSGCYDTSIQQTMLILGVCIMIISTTIAQFVKNPPAGYVPITPDKAVQATQKATVDFTWKEMIRTKAFYLIIFMFLFSATVGLMLIGNISSIANAKLDRVVDGIPVVFAHTALLVSLLALMNGLGRLFGGLLSDKIGRMNTLYIALIVQMFNMIGFIYYTNLPILILGIIISGLCYGSFLTVFPSLTADQFGLKNYGLNYGIVYLFWGLAGIVAPVITNMIYDAQGTFDLAFIICASLMPFVIFANFILKREIAKSSR